MNYEFKALFLIVLLSRVLFYLMQIKFDTIDYLQTGTKRQRKAYAVLTHYKIMSVPETYDPLLVGTIPINIDIETSDLDIICCFTDKEAFHSGLVQFFSAHKNFNVYVSEHSSKNTVIARFTIHGFAVEIFGKNLPTRQQLAYKHMIIEDRILSERGENFRQQILDLKRSGYKTEPAFGMLPGSTQDPYQQLLTYTQHN
jgi:hypothetical protein